MIYRFPSNPIIRPENIGFSGQDGDNINGPSLIKVPGWLERPLGKYYLYFAHHRGNYIRLAYSNCLQGPWVVHAGGVSVSNLPECSHIASPDVHIDDNSRKICMYFHLDGYSDRYPDCKQLTYVSFSKDGLDFSALNFPVGPPYLRAFWYREQLYGIAKGNNNGIILKSNDYKTPFIVLGKVLPRMRHAAVHSDGDSINVYYSRIGDKPESILVTKFSMLDNEQWEKGQTKLVARPEYNYEGIKESLRTSNPGMAKKTERQLRDPAIFIDSEEIFLLYSNAGEQGICISKYVDLHNEYLRENPLIEWLLILMNKRSIRKVIAFFKRLYSILLKSK